MNFQRSCLTKCPFWTHSGLTYLATGFLLIWISEVSGLERKGQIIILVFVLCRTPRLKLDEKNKDLKQIHALKPAAFKSN